MQSILISGGNPATREAVIQKFLSDWKILPYDTVLIRKEEGSVGIADAKELIAGLQHMPQGSPSTVGIIHNAQAMTTEAQNALLKTLEEPPPHARIILEADKPDAILPTILSRTEHIRLSADSPRPEVNIGTLLDADPVSKKMAAAEKIAKDHPDTEAYLDTLLVKIHHTLTPESVSLAKCIYKCKQMLNANLKPQTVLDYLYCGF